MSVESGFESAKLERSELEVVRAEERAARELQAAAARAAVALDLAQHDQQGEDQQLGAAMVAVLAGITALELATGAATDVGASLAVRLAAVEPAAVPAKMVDDALDLLLTGLRSAYLANDIETALPLGKSALALAGHHELPTQVARAHNDIAAIYGRRNFVERAIEHLSAAIGVLEAAGERVTPTLINNLGNVYMTGERIDEALGCFERATVAFIEQGDTFRQGIALANQGRALVSQRRHREAAAALVDALKVFRDLDRRPYVSATLAKLGTCYCELGEHRAAIDWFEAAIKELGDGRSPFAEEVHEAYGRALLKFGELEAALNQLKLAEACARRDGVEITVVDTLKLQAETLAGLGRHEEAYERLSQFITLSGEFEGDRGEALLSAMLVELESGLAADHELPALTSRVLVEANRALRQQAEKLERMSSTDELTQLFNRRHLNQRLEEELSRARRRDNTLSLVLFDVDNFKAINDGYSHLTGDEVLSRVALVLQRTFRQGDVVARWGGEEFAVLLPDTEPRVAQLVADRARAAVAAVGWGEVAAGLSVTVSAGVAATTELTASEAGPDLLKLADRRLYQAKSAGRNRISSN